MALQDRLKDDVLEWRNQKDLAKAHEAAEQLRRVALDEDLPFAERMQAVRLLVEPLLDDPWRNPHEVYELMNAMSKAWKYQERTRPTTAEERLRYRVEINHFRARGLHCGDESERAFGHCTAAQTAIENHASENGVPGKELVLAALRSAEPSVVAETAIQNLGVMAASLKRAYKPGSLTREVWTQDIRDMIDAYLFEGEGALVIYPGAPALVQVLYLFAEGRDPQDAQRVKALRKLDERVRPGDARGQATVPLREVAVARYEGDVVASANQSAKARKSLKDNNLHRHLHVVDEHEYIDEEDDVADHLGDQG